MAYDGNFTRHNWAASLSENSVMPGVFYFLHTYTWDASVEEVCKYPLWQADSECLQCSGGAPLLSWPQLGSCMKKTDTTSHCVCEPDGNKWLRISASLTLKHLFISIVVHFVAVVWKHRLSHFRCAWFNLTQGADGRSDESCSSLNKVFKGQGRMEWWLTKKKLCNSLEGLQYFLFKMAALTLRAF